VDNVTHSLIGTTMGEGIRSLPLFKDSSPKFRFAILWAAIIGNNFPDGDFIINRYLNGGELGYLLHHRGYTHTLIATPLEATATMLIAAAFIGVRGFRGLTRSEWWTLFWVSLGSVCLHSSADFMNDYGVHPFAPFWSRWFYGGFIYIVEPLILASLLPLLVFGFQLRMARGLGWALSALLIGLLWFTKILTWPVALANTLFLALALWAQKRRPGVAQPIAFAFSVLLVFGVMSRMAAYKVREKISLEQPDEKITQLVTTPLPGNPFCWQVIPVSRLDMDGMADQTSIRISGQMATPFFERLGVVSLWPSVFPPETCYFRTEVERTAPLMKASLSADANTFWIGEFRGTVESLSASATQYCRFEQFLHWARVPFYFKMPGNVLLGGDLRYDREPELGFAEHEFQPGEPCLVHAPNWDSPSGLLQSDLQKKQ
jgi:inner membrane protein